MEPGLADRVCTRCGLCCDGSLFADVELAGRAEATRLEVMGLEIEDDDVNGALLSQPCRALQGKRCSIYAHRPECCRTFECRLLQQARHGAAGAGRAKEKIAEARKRIGRVRKLMARVGQRGGHLPLGEGCAEALARDTAADPQVNRARAELEAAIPAVEAWLRKTFLDGGRRPQAHRATGRDGSS